MHKAKYYKKLQDSIVQCTCCDLKCKILPGSSGVCGVRQNIDGDLMSLVYGNVTDIHIDEVGKKGLFHYLLGAEVFSIGTVGCNFACSFCQNWDTSQFPKILKKQSVKDRRTFDMGKEISRVSYQLSPKQAVQYCLDKNLPAIAYTYNEPTVFLEYALDTAKLAKIEGIKNIFVSNGSMSEEVVDDIAEHIDATNIDLKAFTEKFYKKHCKFSLEPVLRNIEAFYKKGVWMEITTLLIPDENDSERELKKCADFISGISPDIPWHVSRFHPDYKMLDKRPTSEKSLLSAYRIGKEAGLNYIYIGNIHSSIPPSTKCPGCEEVLVYRNWFDPTVTESFDLSGKCKKCGYKISGVWK